MLKRLDLILEACSTKRPLQSCQLLFTLHFSLKIFLRFEMSDGAFDASGWAANISRFGRDKSLNLADALCHGKLVIFQLVSPDIIGYTVYGICTKWGPQTIAKLVNVTPITIYNYSLWITIVTGVYKPTYNWGAHIVCICLVIKQPALNQSTKSIVTLRGSNDEMQ